MAREREYREMMAEVRAIQESSENGESTEQAFTEYVAGFLAETADSVNTELAYHEKALGTKEQQKLNAFACSDSGSPILDLYVTCFDGTKQEPFICPQANIRTAAIRVTNFFRKCIYGDFTRENLETSPAFEIARALEEGQDLRENLSKIRVFILTNGNYEKEAPKSVEISGYSISYRVIDFISLTDFKKNALKPIDIDVTKILDNPSLSIPCLKAGNQNEDYDVYIAIIPANFLVEIYEQYDTRLLQQNVRTFLQFRGGRNSVNKGIRKTIEEEPSRFLAYNNGISATADKMEMSEDGKRVVGISNFQIVNGGQTTGVLYHCAKRLKLDLSDIYVQAKISVIRNKSKYSDIVEKISLYANSQNKVNTSDFSSNNESLKEFEKLAKRIVVPIGAHNQSTYWFFERTKYQYSNTLAKDGFTPSLKKRFQARRPQSQVFDKIRLALCVNAYEEKNYNRENVISPRWVVKGKQENFSRFIKYNIPSADKIDNIYFEDSIAKVIIFSSMEELYGDRRRKNAIGDIRNVVVPYTLSLFTRLTDGNLDLYKIWEAQKLSDTLKNQLYLLMCQVNEFIIDNSPKTNVLEWTRASDQCWELVKNNKTWELDKEAIADDMVKSGTKRKKIRTFANEDSISEEDMVSSLSWQTWDKIIEWITENDIVNEKERLNLIYNIRDNIKYSHPIKSVPLGIRIIRIVLDKNPELIYDYN